MLTEEIPFAIKKATDLHKIISEEINLNRIRNKNAADFITKALEKDASKRVEIEKLCNHPFL